MIHLTIQEKNLSILIITRIISDRVQELQQIYSLKQEQGKLESVLKKETQFSRRMDLSMKIKKIKSRIEKHKKNI